MSLALRNLSQDKTRFVLSVLGVALAVMLILFLFGLRAGLFRTAVSYLEHTPGSVVVLPQGGSSTTADRVLWLEDGRFKDMVTMTIDPVCGMAVERDTAVSARRDEQTYYFCARGCRDEFMAAPLSV